MARLKTAQTLSIVIPSLNEASNLPLLIADLKRWPNQLEICVCDGCSSDLSVQVAELAGAKVVQGLEPNRGKQLHFGACNTNQKWLLFLHADSRLATNWPKAVEKIINNKTSENVAWFFDFKMQSDGLLLKLMEISVAIRSNLFNRPYGDQGLLINRSLYKKINGYKPLHLMEDLDLVIRLSKDFSLKRIGIPIYVNGRSWEQVSVLLKAWKNANLRKKWREGKSSKNLSLEYYRKYVA